jgi:hypothetical protein
MHDASQDRLMIQHMSYFRVKRLRLGETFERFIEERLAPNGTLFVLECDYSWPVTKVAERHFFSTAQRAELLLKSICTEAKGLKSS